MKTVVVVFGNLGSGKNTLADFLSGTSTPDLSWTHREVSFAGPVKDVGAHLIGIPPAISYGSQEDKATWTRFGRTARSWLQWIGTELGRDMVNENIWVQRAADTIKESDPAHNFVITDGRFENERCKLQGFLGPEYRVVNVLIYRPSLPVPVGHPPTKFWMSLKKVAGWVGINVPIIHPSEYEVFDMRRRSKKESIFDYLVTNDGTLDDLLEKAKDLVRLIESKEALSAG